MKTSGRLSHLAFAAARNRDHFRSALLGLACSPWENGEAAAFETAYDKILSLIRDDPGLEHLFHLYLVSRFLLCPCPPLWAGAFVSRKIPVRDLLDREEPGPGRWTALPVLTAGSGRARLFWFMAGLVMGGSGPAVPPAWAEKILGQDFQQGVKQAETLVRAQGPDPADQKFLFYPLAVPGQEIPFTGRSASLGFALAFQSLVTQTPLSPDLACTGVLEKNGLVRPVAGLDLKIKTAQDHGFSCLVIPAPNRPGPRGQRLSLLPVQTLAQAWTLASLYSNRQENQLLLFSRALTEPAEFVRRMSALPGQWITWAGKNQGLRDLIRNIFLDPGLMADFARNFERIVDGFDLDRGSAIAGLVAPGLEDGLRESAPTAVLTWISARLSLANHLGQTREARDWETRGQALADQVLYLDIERTATFCNHALVSAHNRFEFFPGPAAPLPAVLNFLENRYALQCEFGCRLDLVLGKLYGTLVQHTAFQGPEQIQKTESLSCKARTALGEDYSPEHQKEWLRQYHYLTLARLAAHDLAGAEKSLKACLGIQTLEEIPARLAAFSSWQISLVCRFLAGAAPAPFTDRIYAPLVSRVLETFEPDHPWQLVCFSLARIALARDDRGTAKVLLEKSRDICLGSFRGPTMEIMALKAMAFLWDLVPEKEFGSFLFPWERQIKQAAAGLNPDWFSFLHDRPFSDALAHVRENLETIFPFSYG